MLSLANKIEIAKFVLGFGSFIFITVEITIYRRRQRKIELRRWVPLLWPSLVWATQSGLLAILNACSVMIRPERVWDRYWCALQMGMCFLFLAIWYDLQRRKLNLVRSHERTDRAQARLNEITGGNETA